MHFYKLIAASMVSVASLLAGCATTSDIDRRVHLESPQQSMESIRLIICRPQTLVGLLGRPVDIVNGQQMGIKGSPVNENFLEPDAVFVVDAPGTLTCVPWLQSSKAKSSGEAITYQGLQGVMRYLRWALKPTYGYLQEANERIAAEEIPRLRYTGYLDLTKLQ